MHRLLGRVSTLEHLPPMSQPKAHECSYSAKEELAHALTHGVGTALSVAGLVLLVVRAAHTGDPWRIVSFAIFGSTMVLLYGASTLYHSLTKSRIRHVFKTMDHALIYVLIAGTYTPFLLVTLRGPWGWTLFGIVWGLTVAGVIFKICFAGRFRGASTLLYLGMGWLGVIAAKPMFAALPTGGLWWLLAGGLAYSFGTLFYMRKSMAYHHAVWHLFVLAGTACHFQAVYSYIGVAA